MKLSYLAAPYAHKDPMVKRYRRSVIVKVAGELMKQGEFVFSPNIAIDESGFAGNWELWKPFGFSMLSRCDRLLILKLPGWEASRGVKAEREKAEELGIPIEEIDPPETVDVKSLTMEEYAQKLEQFLEERDWDKFHSPKNLAMALSVEAAEVMEHFLWKSDKESYDLGEKLDHVKDEIGDVFCLLVALSKKLGIDLLDAADNKLVKTAEKYPVETSRGKNLKYNDL